MTTLATTDPSVISLMMMSLNGAAVKFFGVLVLLNITAFWSDRGCKCVDCGWELGGNDADEMIPPPGAAAVSVTGTDPPWVKVIPPLPAPPATELGIVEMMLFTLALTLLLLLL